MISGREVLPWTNTNPQLEQERFILAALEGRESFSSLCQAFGISRKTGTSGCTALRMGDSKDWGTAAERRTATPAKCLRKWRSGW